MPTAEGKKFLGVAEGQADSATLEHASLLPATPQGGFTFDQIHRYFTSRLANERLPRAKQVSAHCPFHPDDHVSLSINMERGLWKCHGCYAHGGMLGFERQRFPDLSPEEARHSMYLAAGAELPKQRRRLINTYRYVSAMGILLYEKLRYDPKGFGYRRPGEHGSWFFDLVGVNKVPYRLPELITGNLVFVVEGERDADNLTEFLKAYQQEHSEIRIAVTTSCDGAGDGKWLAGYNPFFSGKTVVCMPDNDEVGKRFAQQVAEGVSQFADSVHILALPGLESKGDVTDWIGAGHTVGDFFALLKDARPFTGSVAEGGAVELANPFDNGSDTWPEPMSESAFYGLAGDFVRLMEPETEADRQALLVIFLVIFGCMVGRRPYYQVESTRHRMNLFAVLVGETSTARKGTATDRVIQVLSQVDPKFFDVCQVSGLSSGEGLIHAIRDPREEDVDVNGSKVLLASRSASSITV